MNHQGKILKNLLKEHNISQQKAAEIFGISRSTVQVYLDKVSLEDWVIEKIVKVTGADKDRFFQNQNEQYRKKYEELLEKYVSVVEELRIVEQSLKKCQEENNFEPGTLEYTLNVYRKSSKIADQRINTLEEENEEFRQELIELRTKIRKYEGR